MQEDGIDDPCDQAPCLFGVPAPVAAPRFLRPNGTRDDAETQKQESQSHRPIDNEIQRVLIGEMAVRQAAGFQPVSEHQNHRHREGHAEGTVADNGHGHMKAQPAALQRRHQSVNFPALHRRIAQHQKHQRHHKGPQRLKMEFSGK